MALDINYNLFEDHLSRSLGLSNVKIRPFDFGSLPDPGFSGDFRSWDIEYVSIGGTVPYLTCDISGIQVTYELFFYVAANPPPS